jgi:hypothetical protein
VLEEAKARKIASEETKEQRKL